MEIAEIEQTVGRLYLMIVDQQKHLAERDARILELTPKPPQTIFAVPKPE